MTSRLLAAIAFLGCIVGANYAVTHYGMVPVGFGLMATAGTYLAGATFILRDAIQDKGGRRFVVVLIAIGAGLSAILSPQLALASGAAFLLSELCDLAVYTPLRRKGYLRAAVASNVVGAVIDSAVFLTLAGFPLWTSLPGQVIGKVWLTVAVVLAVGGARALLRQPKLAEGA